MTVDMESRDPPGYAVPEGEAAFGFRHYVDVLRRRRWVLLATLAAAVAAALIVSLVQSPTYRARTKILVGERQGVFPPGDATAFEPFSATLRDLLKSNIVARGVIANIDFHKSEKKLLDEMSVSVTPQSSVLNISIVDHSRAHAEAIAASVGSVFSRLIERRFGASSPAGAKGATPLSAVVWDPAHLDPGRVSPHPVRNVVIAAVLGLAVGIFLSFLWDAYEPAPVRRSPARRLRDV